MLLKQVLTAVWLAVCVFGAHAGKKETRVCAQYREFSEKIEFFENAKKTRVSIDTDSDSYKFYLALVNDPRYMDQVRLACDQSRLPGARLGMTAKQVIESTNWGKPESIRRSTGVWGVRETWVYGDGYYLYFKNDELTDIQN